MKMPTIVIIGLLVGILFSVMGLWFWPHDSPLRWVAGVSILVSAALLALWALCV